ncbi:MAG: hypothetical protein JXQ76_10885 [Campylobacterales bacterium]|nr:hypothetical protein [Campylobacterales bacterium]
MRNLALNYPIHSVVDQLALNQLVQANADLGRVGGLFKMWLSNDSKKRQATLGNHGYERIDQLVDEIIDKQDEILRIAQKLIHGS